MIEKLKILKKRAENLRYKDDKELDDILRKTKMYIGKIFPMKPTYSSELDSISFSPSFFYSGMGEQPERDSWASGKQNLINFLDTRIEELSMEMEAKPNTKSEPRVIEKIVTVQDSSRINELNQEIVALRRSKSLWNRINWAIFIPSILTLLGGAFILGIYIGKAQFDIEKLDLLEKNKSLESHKDSLIMKLDSANKELQSLTKLIPEDLVKQSGLPLPIEISFLSPTSIFDGEMLISAHGDYDDKAIVNFKGIRGVSKTITGPFNSLEIIIKQGERFYLKSEQEKIYSVNVLASSINVKLEIIESN